MDVIADTNPTASEELDESTETGVTLMPGLSDDVDESEGDALATIAEASDADPESAGLSVSLPAPIAVIWTVNVDAVEDMLPKLPGVSEDDGDAL